MKMIIILIIGLGGLWLSIQHLRRNLAELKAKPKNAHRLEDKIFNYPLMLLWFGYLIVFFSGLIVNNLILH